MPKRADDDLADLEASDPDVAEAARRLDDVIWRVTHPEDVANPMRDEVWSPSEVGLDRHA